MERVEVEEERQINGWRCLERQREGGGRTESEMEGGRREVEE